MFKFWLLPPGLQLLALLSTSFSRRKVVKAVVFVIARRSVSLKLQAALRCLRAVASNNKARTAYMGPAPFSPPISSGKSRPAAASAPAPGKSAASEASAGEFTPPAANSSG